MENKAEAPRKNKLKNRFIEMGDRGCSIKADHWRQIFAVEVQPME
jgi:hypothetical protein